MLCPGCRKLRSLFVARTYFQLELDTLASKVLCSGIEPHNKIQRPLTVVLVDDEEWRLEMFRAVVVDNFKGVAVRAFQDAEEAWRELSRADPDLLVTDDVMGQLNGDELVRRLADRKVAYPIIVISALDGPETAWVSDCGRRGVDVTMLRAPFPVESFVRALESALRISRDMAGAVQMAERRAPALSTDAEALLRQGKDFYFGYGVSKSYSEAFALFSKAAAAGHPEAQFHVALCFEDGDGVELDQVQAADWYRKAATAGFAKAQNNLAICYRDDQGVPSDYAEAEKWYCMAAEQGYAPTSCRPENESDSKDGAAALRWYRNESPGHGLRCEHLSSFQESGTVKRMGFYYRYKFGHGAPKDGAQAVKWYRMAAEQGCADAQTNLGVCYEFGHGVAQDHAEAARWYRMAAEQECADAQNKLMVGIQSGCIVPLDSDEEWKWYQREQASRVTKAFQKEAKWGDRGAQFFMGLHYENGYGIREDIIEAYKWFKLAAAQDHKEGSKKAAEKLTSLSSRMTSDQVEEGERRFREFKTAC